MATTKWYQSDTDEEAGVAGHHRLQSK
jgi:hypothetical protein